MIFSIIQYILSLKTLNEISFLPFFYLDHASVSIYILHRLTISEFILIAALGFYTVSV